RGVGVDPVWPRGSPAVDGIAPPSWRHEPDAGRTPRPRQASQYGQHGIGLDPGTLSVPQDHGRLRNLPRQTRCVDDRAPHRSSGASDQIAGTRIAFHQPRYKAIAQAAFAIKDDDGLSHATTVAPAIARPGARAWHPT